MDCLDKAAARAGLSRGSGPDVKSSVRLIGSDEASCRFDEEAEGLWATDYVRATCQILPANSSVKVLGAMIGPSVDRNRLFRDRVSKLTELRNDLADIGDACVELTLVRLCANVSKVAHSHRAHSCDVCPDVFDECDSGTSEFESVLGGELLQHSLDQSAVGLGRGGLGLRRAATLAALSHLASIVESRPFVVHLLSLAQDAGIPLDGAAGILDSMVLEAKAFGSL